jgi:NAD(P)-dependent dehydrogenase (short-subunit alcohol dehydrogenase family)
MTYWTGRTVLITGANSGLGLAAARELARAGAHVVLAVRDVTKGEHAASTLDGHVEVRHLDLADLASVRAFAEDWTADLDVLINNAGVANAPLGRTKDGFETHIGVNHLGPFVLTNLLLPRITDRVVTVGSNAHRSAAIDLDDLNWERRPYRSSAAYAQSKLANLLFTLELQGRLDAAGVPVRALAAHPGAAATNLNRHLGPLMRVVAATVGRLVMQDAVSGAQPILYAASGELPGASYAGPAGPREQRGAPTLVGRSAAAADPGLAARLWTLSEQLTATSFPLRSRSTEPPVRAGNRDDRTTSGGS